MLDVCPHQGFLRPGGRELHPQIFLGIATEMATNVPQSTERSRIAPI
jgi:hypothetical protein